MQNPKNPKNCKEQSLVDVLNGDLWARTRWHQSYKSDLVPHCLKIRSATQCDHWIARRGIVVREERGGGDVTITNLLRGNLWSGKRYGRGFCKQFVEDGRRHKRRTISEWLKGLSPWCPPSSLFRHGDLSSQNFLLRKQQLLLTLASTDHIPPGPCPATLLLQHKKWTFNTFANPKWQDSLLKW
jgi:hypothetical protein